MSVVPAQGDPAVEASKALVATVRAPGFQQEVAAALPEDVPAHRFVRATVTALLANPDIALSDHNSVLNSLMRSAQDGLVPDGREAAIVIYKGKAQYLPMVGGLRKIAAEHGWSLRSQIVYANDEFQFEKGLDETLRHVPVRPGQPRGDRIAAYAVAVHRDGRREFEVMYPDDIEKRRKASRYGDRGPWVEWTERMWEKTAAKALFQQLPLDPNDRRVASMLTDGIDDPVAAVYGHRPVEGEIPPERPALAAGLDTPSGAGDAPTQEAGGGQQAAGGTDTPAAPAPDPEPEPPAPAAAADAPKPPTLAKARKVVMPSGMAVGRSLGELAEGDGAVTWFVYQLNNLSELDPEIAAAIEVVAKADVPAAWEQTRS